MADWIINQDTLGDVDPPRSHYPCRAKLFPEQLSFLDKSWNSSMIINGGPGTGKTILAIMKAAYLFREGKKCLYIAPTSLSLKYAKHEFRSLGLQEQMCSSYYEFERNTTQYDVLLVDDSQRYKLNQILSLLSHTQYLLLFGDYSYNLYRQDTASINEISKAIIGCQLLVIHTSYGIPFEFLRLIPG